MVLAVSNERGAVGETSGSPRQGETMSDTDKSADTTASSGKANLTPKTSASNLSERRNANIGELPTVSAFATAQHHSETARQRDIKKPPTIKYDPPTPQQGDFRAFLLL